MDNILWHCITPFQKTHMILINAPDFSPFYYPSVSCQDKQFLPSFSFSSSNKQKKVSSQETSTVRETQIRQYVTQHITRWKVVIFPPTPNKTSSHSSLTLGCSFVPPFLFLQVFCLLVVCVVWCYFVRSFLSLLSLSFLVFFWASQCFFPVLFIGGGALGSFDGFVGVSCTVLSLYILAFRLTLTCSSVRLFHCTNTYILHFIFIFFVFCI